MGAAPSLQLSVAVAVPGFTVAVHSPGAVLVVMLSGQLICGSSLSKTTTVCSHDELLPAASVAVQVIVVVPTGNGSVIGLLSLRVGVGITVPSQLSVAVATPGETLALQVPGKIGSSILAGQVIAGAVVSLTVNVVVAVDELPAPSLLLEPSFAVSVIVCVPTPTIVPGAGSCVTVIRPLSSQPGEVSAAAHEQLSETAVPVVKSGTGAIQLASAEAVWPGGGVIDGGVTSLTVIVCVQEALPVRWASSSSALWYGPAVS